MTVLPSTPRPNHTGSLREVDTAVADAIGRRFIYDSIASLQDYGDVMVRVFRDAPPDPIIANAAAPAIAALQASWEDLPPDAQLDIVRCPFTADQFDTLDVYLRTLQWRDPEKDVEEDEALRSIGGGPVLWDLFEQLDAFVHCQVWFGVRDITQSEIERIRQVALANDIPWMEFAMTTGTIGQPAFDEPQDPPEGFLPHFELPWYCTPPACTGNEPQLSE